MNSLFRITGENFRLTSFCAVICLSAKADAGDIVINNGRGMDPETLFDSVANVEFKYGRIAVITKEAIAGKRRTHLQQ